MNLKMKIQKFGGFLAGMVIPNIGAFIAWGLITAIFIETGWFPNKELAKMISPILTYLLPILIAFTGGRLIYDQRGGVVGSVAAMGAIVGSDIPMFLAAMVLGPLGGYAIKKIDKFLEGKIKSGFEMLVSNFSIGILGMLLAIGAFYIIGPIIASATELAMLTINKIIEAGFISLLAIIIEPAKVIFLNNAIDQGIFVPLGALDILKQKQTLFFMLVSSPAPGCGILLAYSIFGKGVSKKSAPAALIIQFIGGIHEVYFPYVLMKPILFLSIILGGMAQISTWVLTDAGLAGYPHPGSIISFLIMLPKGGFIPVMSGIIAGITVTFFTAAFFLKLDKSVDSEEDITLSADIANMLKVPNNDMENKNIQNLEVLHIKDLTTIIFACDAGLGSSAMGAGILKKKLKEADLNFEVKHMAIDTVPKNTKMIICHSNLKERAYNAAPKAKIRTIVNFLNDPNYDIIIKEIKEGEIR